MLSNISPDNADDFLGVVFFQPVQHIEYKNNINTFIAKESILTKKYNKYFLGEEEVDKSWFGTLFLYENKKDCIVKCKEFIKKHISTKQP